MIATLLSQGWVIATLLAVIAISFALALSKLKRSTSLKSSKLRAHKKLLSQKEQKVFQQLADALEHEFHVFTKVSVLELMQEGFPSRTGFLDLHTK